ncbi:MAG: peptidoglycan-binding protein [Fibrobacteres bacterium]|nr:peptidoglycan-binding protein [Fibrobacterota bacterium]
MAPASGRIRTVGFGQASIRFTEAQLILQDLGAYKGQAAGMMDDETRAALKAYQKGAALPESGVLDTATRKSLLHGYFGREGTTATKDARIEACVCTGKTDFVKLPCGEAVEDDRVEVLFSEPRLEGEVPQSADGRWDKWMKQVRETEDVERYGLHLRITDHNGWCPGACVKVIGPSTQETKADEHGWVSVVPLERGHYEVELWEEGERIGESELDIPARGAKRWATGSTRSPSSWTTSTRATICPVFPTTPSFRRWPTWPITRRSAESSSGKPIPIATWTIPSKTNSASWWNA